MNMKLERKMNTNKIYEKGKKIKLLINKLENDIQLNKNEVAEKTIELTNLHLYKEIQELKEKNKKLNKKVDDFYNELKELF